MGIILRTPLKIRIILRIPLSILYKTKFFKLYFLNFLY